VRAVQRAGTEGSKVPAGSGLRPPGPAAPRKAASEVVMDDRPVIHERVDEVEPAGWTAWMVLIRLVTFLFGVLQIALVLRILLLFLGADQGNTIVSDIVNVTNPFVDPFRGMFSIDQIKPSAGSVLDVAAVVALVGWTILEALIVGLLRVVGR
jgi:hypothetical protein